MRFATRRPSGEPGPTWKTAFGVAVASATLFALTAEWGIDQNVDAVAAALPAWSLAETGSISLPAFAAINPWVAEGAIGLVSNRPPGVWLLATMAYAMARPFTDGFTVWPATLTAIITTVSAVALMFVVFDRLVDRRTAATAALVFAFGTATWPISAAQLWPHGTVQLWLAAGMLASVGNRSIGAGIADGMAILTRPPTAVIAAVRGIHLAWARRRWMPLFAVGGPAVVGTAALLTYNRVVFGSWGVSGGYGSDFGDNLTSMSLRAWASNAFGMFVDPQNGLLIWSPVVLAIAPAVPSAWRRAPDWCRGGALAGVVYVLVHARLNRVSGGLPFDYRYQLPLATLAAPLLVVSYRDIADRSPRWARIVAAAALLSVLLQLANATLLDCAPGPEWGESVCEFRI